MPSSYQFVLWKQESFLIPPAFFRILLGLPTEYIAPLFQSHEGPKTSIAQNKIDDRQLAGGHACKRVRQHFIYKSPSNRESPELVTHFNPAYPTDTMKPDGTWYPTESRQYKFDLNFDPDGRSLSREYKHSTLAYVQAAPGVVMVHAVGPAEQEWQRYLKPPRIPSLDRLIHIRTQFSFADRLTIAMTRARHKRVIVLGGWGRALHLIKAIRYFVPRLRASWEGQSPQHRKGPFVPRLEKHVFHRFDRGAKIVTTEQY